MKVLIAILLLAVILLQEWNNSRINRLQQQINVLQARLNVEETKTNKPSEITPDIAIKAARSALNQAQTELQNTNIAQAKRNLDIAAYHLDEAMQYAGKSAGPALDWLKLRLKELNGQLASQLKPNKPSVVK